MILIVARGIKGIRIGSCDPGRGSWFGLQSKSDHKERMRLEQTSIRAALEQTSIRAARRQITSWHFTSFAEPSSPSPSATLVILSLWTRQTFWESETSKAHLTRWYFTSSHTSSTLPRSRSSSPWSSNVLGGHIHLFHFKCWLFALTHDCKSCPSSYFPGYCQPRQSIPSVVGIEDSCTVVEVTFRKTLIRKKNSSVNSFSLNLLQTA